MSQTLLPTTTTVCNKTGLPLVAVLGHVTWRVQKYSYGPLNPIQRPDEDDIDVTKWGRWDVPAHRTIYSAASSVGAYVETLGWAQKKHVGGDFQLKDLFDDEVDPEATVMEKVEEEFRANNWMAWGQIPAEWRHERRLYTLRLPVAGWYIDVDLAEAITVFNTKLPRLLKRLEIKSLNLSDLFGDRRELTTGIARYAWGRVLFDGSLPHGIRYKSKMGADYDCYATWLRKLDDGMDLASEPTVQIGTQQIEDCDPDLWRAASQLGLHVH